MNNLSKPKLLYLITQAEWGGAQRYIFDLATALNQNVDISKFRNFDITVAVGKPRGAKTLPERLQTQGVKTRTFRHLVRQINPWHDTLAIFEIAAFLKKEKFDLIHSNSSKAGFLCSIAALLGAPKTKIVYTAHGWVFEEPLPFWQKKFYLWLEKAAARRRSATIVLSQSEYEIALKHKLGNKHNLFIIPHGINLSTETFLSRSEARQKLRVNENAFIIGSVANFYHTKGTDILIKAFAEIKQKDARLILIGDGPEDAKLKNLTENLGLKERVSFLGAIPEAARFLAAFNIFVLPSRKEGLPYALLEAMAAGLPVIATSVGGVPEIIENEKNGLLARSENLEELVRQIDRLLDDRPLREKLGAEAKKFAAEQFSFNAMLQKTLAVYKKMM